MKNHEYVCLVFWSKGRLVTNRFRFKIGLVHFCSEFFPGKYCAKANENCTEFCSNVLVHVFDDPEILIINQKKIVH